MIKPFSKITESELTEYIKHKRIGHPLRIIETEYGKLSLCLYEIVDIVQNPEKDLLGAALISPYGLSITSTGQLYKEHLYLLATVDKKADDDHFSLRVYLPNLNEPRYIGWDYPKDFGGRKVAFFRDFRARKRSRLRSTLDKRLVFKAPPYGLLVIPENISLIKKIKMILNRIPEKNWKNSYSALKPQLEKI